MSKRKPRYEGPAYCDYQDLFDSITVELENIYPEAEERETVGWTAKNPESNAYQDWFRYQGIDEAGSGDDVVFKRNQINIMWI